MRPSGGLLPCPRRRRKIEIRDAERDRVDIDVIKVHQDDDRQLIVQ
jgi:hypothetical protein